MSWHPDFERAFNPRSIAIVGASESNINHPGNGFIRGFQQLGFKGQIYPVNPKLKELLGLQVFPNLRSLPESPDLVIVSTPARQVPAVLEDCIAADAKNVHIFTAGFSESGEALGRRLEEKVKDIALRGELRVVGPNCMGVIVPKVKMQTINNSPIKTGSVAFLSQSGGHAIQFSNYAPKFGIGFSKIISYGNGCIMDSTDFLEYLATDPDTKIITIYMEGVRDGRKLVNLVRDINPAKPVIIWKGGTSDLGSRAAASHTASLAGSPAIWNSFFKQIGAVHVSSLDELTDVTMTFLYLTPPAGRRMGLLLGGGGRGVSASDTCDAHGIKLPHLTSESRNKLSSIIPQAGTSLKNPIDAYPALVNLKLFEQTLKVMIEDPQLDIVLADLDLNVLMEIGPKAIDKLQTIMTSLAKKYSGKKTLVAILGTGEGKKGISAERSRLQKEFSQAGIGAYRTLPRACRALDKFIGYHEFQQKLK